MHGSPRATCGAVTKSREYQHAAIQDRQVSHLIGISGKFLPIVCAGALSPPPEPRSTAKAKLVLAMSYQSDSVALNG